MDLLGEFTNLVYTGEHPWEGKNMKRSFLILTIALISGRGVSAETLEVKPYGFFLPKYIFATAGLVSFTTPFHENQNEVAPSAAALADIGTNAHPRTTWQIGQSRFGVVFGYGSQLSGTLEVDFVNNLTAASPEFVLLAPRLRLAKIDYRISPTLALTFGQDWDIFNGGVGAYTYNTVGNYYQAGNVGFLRQQLVVRIGESRGWNLSLALGMPQKNDQTNARPGHDAGPELTLLPTTAANLTYKEDNTNFYGVSLIAGRVLYTPSTQSAHSASGISLFGLKDFGLISLHAKAYYGKNLHNLKTITLVSGGAINGQIFDVYEYGGFFTLNTMIEEVVGVFAGAGYGSVFNTNSIPAGAGLLGTILTGNRKLVVGADFRLRSNLYAYAEISSFRSRYNEGSPANINAYVATMVDVGMKLNI